MAHVTPLGTMAFGSLQEPRLNTYSNRVEWVCALSIPVEEAAPLIQLAQECIEKAAKNDAKIANAIKEKRWHKPYKMAAIKEQDGTKIDDPNNLLFIMKRPAVRTVRGEDKQLSPPVLYGSDGKPMTSFNDIIGSGSKGRLVFNTYVYSKQQCGVQYQLEGFQLSEVVVNNAAPDSLDAIAGNVTSDTEELSINEPETFVPAL